MDGVGRQSAPGGVPPARTVATSGLATGGGDLSANRTINVPAAVQSDQETASSNAVAITPGVQQFHPSAAKCWLYSAVTGGVPAMTASYNITSVTDTAVGRLTVTIATDFSSANWAALATIDGTGVGSLAATSLSQAAGSVEIRSAVVSTGVLTDPAGYSFAGFGDQ